MRFRSLILVCVHAQHICLLLVDEIVQRPRYRSQAVPNRIRSFGFPQHLHSIRVTRRSPSKASCIFPYVFRQTRALAKARSRSATTCLLEEAATAVPLIAIPRLETKWKISEYPLLIPLSFPARWRTWEKCKSTSLKDVLLADRIPPFSNLNYWGRLGLCDKT